jgi:hypothetical protein
MKKNVEGGDRGTVAGRDSEKPREIQPGWAVSGLRFELWSPVYEADVLCCPIVRDVYFRLKS